MNQRLSRDFINNPTFNKLLESATKYEHLVPINEQEQPAAPAQPQPNQPADSNPAPFVIDVASSAFDLLQSMYNILSPEGKQAIPSLSINPTNDMEVYLGNIDNQMKTIISKMDPQLYDKVIKAANTGFESYKKSLTSFKGYEGIKKNVPGLKERIAANLKQFVDKKGTAPKVDYTDVPEDQKPRQRNPQEIPPQNNEANGNKKEAPKNPVAFGDFVNFETFEARLAEAKKDQYLDNLDKDYRIASDATKSGNDRKAGKFRRKVFNDVIEGCESLISQIDAVQLSISIGMHDAIRRGFPSYKMSPDFSEIGKSVLTLQKTMQSGDTGSSEHIETTINELKGLKNRFDSLKSKFDKQYDLDRTQVIHQSDNPDAYTNLKAGDDNKQVVQGFSLATNKADANAINNPKAEAPVKGEAKKSEGGKSFNDLKISQPIQPGMKKGVKDANVASFQMLVIDRFGKMDVFKNSPVFQKFVKYQGDGKFGNTTATVIKAVKAGFNMEDKGPDITQELIDKVKATGTETPSPKNESLVLSFDSFTKVLEDFNTKAAGDVLNAVNTAPSGHNTKKIVKTTGLNIPASEVSKQANLPKVPNSKVKETIEQHDERLKGEWNRELKIEKLVSLGAKKNDAYDGDKVMAIATGEGARFYDNGVALRTFDKMLGYYNTDKDEFKGTDGSLDKISSLIKGDLPAKYSDYVTKLIIDIYGNNNRNKKLYQDLMKWDANQIKCLALAYKNMKTNYSKSANRDLDKDLGNEMTNTDEIRLFQKKFASVL